MTGRIALLALTGLSLARTTASGQSMDTLPERVDGRRIHMIAAGNGAPTVVLEVGFRVALEHTANLLA